MSNNIARILCATDTSRASQHAVTKAAALATHFDAELTIIYVSPTGQDDRDIPPMLAGLREVKRLADEMLRHDQQALDVLVEGARASGARVRRYLAVGDAAEEIAKSADEFDADLVVVATHGRTGINKFLLGSTAERVVRTCSRPVMVTRNPVFVPTNGYSRVLVPTDFSESSQRAFQLAGSLAGADCSIELLHCWRLPPGVGAGPAAVVESITASIDLEIRARGQIFIDSLEVPGNLSVHFQAVRQPPTQGVTDRIAEGAHELVVMGSHGRSGLSRFLLGSVAETTIHHAPCSVVTVPDAL